VKVAVGMGEPTGSQCSIDLAQTHDPISLKS
jgi:hypothetical protein